MTSTPLMDRIKDRRKVGRIGPVSPVPITRHMSEFSKRLAAKRLPVKEWMHDGCGPDGAAA